MRRAIGSSAPLVMTAQITQASNAPLPVVQAQNAAVAIQQRDQAQYQASIAAYQQSLTKLAPLWSPLPTTPYPPSGDDSNFPHSGTPSLYVNRSQVSAAQLAEPQKIVYYQKLDADAAFPKLNWYFVVGAACLVGYFYVRRQST